MKVQRWASVGIPKKLPVAKPAGADRSAGEAQARYREILNGLASGPAPVSFEGFDKGLSVAISACKLGEFKDGRFKHGLAGLEEIKSERTLLTIKSLVEDLNGGKSAKAKAGTKIARVLVDLMPPGMAKDGMGLAVGMADLGIKVSDPATGAVVLSLDAAAFAAKAADQVFRHLGKPNAANYSKVTSYMIQIGKAAYMTWAVPETVAVKSGALSKRT